ncbi:hypothetical protein F2P56_001922 [Juglans regia]|uniref:Bifunctional epoxide hydrolase 2-like n=1 Tax=Juglans regia TaxID=51240 RepID=A0A834D4J3_JUGRE|nr:hypothetical protein F2P56_001922 [Juglans regia]
MFQLFLIEILEENDTKIFVNDSGINECNASFADASFADANYNYIRQFDQLDFSNPLLDLAKKTSALAFIVGKDFGAMPAYLVAAVHPERVTGVITLGVPFILPGTSAVQNHLLPEGFYITRWQEPGRAEADFGRFDVKTVIRNIYLLFSGSEVPVAAEGQEIMDLYDPSTPLPPWFSEEDLSVYASLYEKSGFRFALRVPYRSLTVDCGITDPKVKAPSLLIMGEKDYVLKFPGMEDYIRSGAVKQIVPDLEIKFMPEGSHFVHEQLPKQVNELIITFLDKHI